MKVTLESTHPRCHYRGRKAVGELFEASKPDARVLVALGRARYQAEALRAEEPTTDPVTELEATEETVEPVAEAPKRRTYRRRDLQAQS